MEEGAASERDRGKIGTAAALGRALVRFCEQGVGDEGGPRGSVGEGERRASGRPRGEGFGRAPRWGRPARLLVGCGSALLGRLAWASAGPVGLARAWAFSFFLN